MQALIKKIQGEWKAAKDAAQAQCTNNAVSYTHLRAHET